MKQGTQSQYSGITQRDGGGGRWEGVQDGGDTRITVADSC